MYVSCHPTVQSQFFQFLHVDFIFIGLVTFYGYFRPLCPNRVHVKYSGVHVKVHSGYFAHSNKQTHIIGYNIVSDVLLIEDAW